ncbi:PREDICTED: uncharacterized protein LOC105314964 isoform X2 [Amphimedon queenslandica]|uniref:Ribosome biogenesis protein NOP53 n=1 Tax=Amphimedon queenslandica TaxID=400682 RepID=A0AAN0JST3_AMPQE|nr:PREDICTED: uncharacterized protein LOC105314964 isoform X2 [Amphimedon queenslandica]|eukprot:XP_019860097.1 PREDICTED: uncharacterized protein LOC105314964 isoform X2 [Amphimedon queenslandica]
MQVTPPCIRTPAIEKSNKELFVIARASDTLSDSSKEKSRALRSEYHCDNHSAVTLPAQNTKKRYDNEDNDKNECDSSEEEADVPQESMYNYINNVVANDVKTRAFNSLTNTLIEAKPVDIWANEGEKGTPLPRRPGVVFRSNIANIEIPHSGTSYNPSFKDHQV